MTQDLDFEDDEMERQFAEVRGRFVQTLDQRMAQINQAFGKAVGDTEAAACRVEDGYRELHSICGMAGLVGFPQLGVQARAALNAAALARREQRGLREAERIAFKPAFERLTATARSIAA